MFSAGVGKHSSNSFHLIWRVRLILIRQPELADSFTVLTDFDDFTVLH
jgi:hypothetical protein